MNYFKIKNVTNETADIFIYGDIVDDGWKWYETDITPQDIKVQLDALKGKELHIYINSCGGDVFAGTAIHNMIKRHEAKVVGHVDGIAASIASVILMACDEIVVPANAYVMIHRPMAGVYGNIDDLMNTCTVLETVEAGIIETYQLHSELSKEELSTLMAAETWFTGEQFSKKFTNSVQVTETIKAVACATDISFRHFPKLEDKSKAELEKMEIEIALALS